MRIITKLREWKPSEPTTLIQLRDEDKHKLSAMVLDIVKQQLEAKGLTPITITVDLAVDMQVLLPTTPDAPKNKDKTNA